MKICYTYTQLILILDVIPMMTNCKMCSVHVVAWVLMTVGALNWGLVGAFKFNLVNAILGAWPGVERLVYVLVGVAALMMLAMAKCKACSVSPSQQKSM